MSLLYIILQIPLSTVAQPEARLAPLPQQLLIQLVQVQAQLELLVSQHLLAQLVQVQAPLSQQLLVQLAVLVQLLLLQPLVQRVQRPALP